MPIENHLGTSGNSGVNYESDFRTSRRNSLLVTGGFLGALLASVGLLDRKPLDAGDVYTYRVVTYRKIGNEYFASHGELGKYVSKMVTENSIPSGSSLSTLINARAENKSMDKVYLLSAQDVANIFYSNPEIKSQLDAGKDFIFDYRIQKGQKGNDRQIETSTGQEIPSPVIFQGKNYLIPVHTNYGSLRQAELDMQTAGKAPKKTSSIDSRRGIFRKFKLFNVNPA